MWIVNRPLTSSSYTPSLSLAPPRSDEKPFPLSDLSLSSFSDISHPSQDQIRWWATFPSQIFHSHLSFILFIFAARYSSAGPLLAMMKVFTKTKICSVVSGAPLEGTKMEGITIETWKMSWTIDSLMVSQLSTSSISSFVAEPGMKRRPTWRNVLWFLQCNIKTKQEYQKIHEY